MGKTNKGKKQSRTSSAASAPAKKRVTKAAVEEAPSRGAFRITSDPVDGGRQIEEDAHKFEVRQPSAPESPEPAFEDLGELPRSYGENTLYVVARDPQWLFAYWDIDWNSPQAAEAKRRDARIFLKVLSAGGEQESLTQINPEARNWYLPAQRSGAEYRVELGFFDESDKWVAISKSGGATTPSSRIAGDDGSPDFATVPIHLTFQRLLDMVRDAMAAGDSLLTAIAKVQGDGEKLAFTKGQTPEWSDDQKRILAALLGDEAIDALSMGSEEIDRLLRRQLSERLHTESASELAVKGRLGELFGPEVSSLFSGASSLFSGVGASWSAQPFSQPERGFFMHVNAEVIFYGGTHPDAKVTIDGKPVQLQPDGSFRYHFRFPDGDFKVPIVAVSPDGVEERSATLEFSRETSRQGDVGSTDQPSDLPVEPMGRKP